MTIPIVTVKRYLFTAFLLLCTLTTLSHAQITIMGERLDQLHVETDAYTVLFDRGTITELHNKRTGETHTLAPGANPNPGFSKQAAIVGRGNIKDWSPRWDADIQINKITDHHADIVFRKGGNAITLSIGIDPANNDLLIGGQAVSAIPGVIGIQWSVENLDLHNLKLIMPNQSVQQIDASSGIQHKSFQYPDAARWQAQLAIVESQFGGFYVRSTDPTFRFKELEYETDAGSFGLAFKTINQAPWDTLRSAESVTWRLNTYAGEWCVPAQIHRDWMEQAFNPVRLADMPEWVGDIGLVVLHTALDTEMLAALAQQVEPAQTLLYVVDYWNKGPFRAMVHPDYASVHSNFDQFVDVARHYGFRIMLHVNILVCSPAHPLYHKFKKYQVRDTDGKLEGAYWDDIGHPWRLATISLGSSEWRRLLIRQFKSLREKYAVDAFMLDVSHFIFNDGNGLVEGLTSAEASILMHRELMEAMPGVVLAGEYVHAVTFFRESLSQRSPSNYEPHPLSAFLFSPYNRMFGDLGFPYEHSPQELGRVISSHEPQGVIPTARILNPSTLNKPLTSGILAVARQWQTLKLMSDVNCDWDADTLFQLRTQGGGVANYQYADGVYSFTTPGGTITQRVYGVTAAVTDWSLPGWHAYNETMLLGLNPDKYYSLRDAPRDPSQLHINALPSGASLAETRVTEVAAVFRLEPSGDLVNTSIGLFLPTPPVAVVPDTLRALAGEHYTLEARPSQSVVIILSAPSIRLPYNLRDAPYTAGLQIVGIFRLGNIDGSGRRSTATLDGIHKKTIYAHPPRYDAETIIQFAFTLPETSSTLSYSAGIQGQNSNGVVFEIRLNGKTRVELFKDTFDWTNGEVSLAEFAGQPVLLEFVTGPGPHGENDSDWAHWGDLLITADNPADVNGDSIVNILDLTLVAQGFGTGDLTVDVNGDGVVNVFDLVFVAGQF